MDSLCLFASTRHPFTDLQLFQLWGKGKWDLLSLSSYKSLSREVVEGTWHSWTKHLGMMGNAPHSLGGQRWPALLPAVMLTVHKKYGPNQFWAMSPFLQKYSQMLGTSHEHSPGPPCGKLTEELGHRSVNVALLLWTTSPGCNTDYVFHFSKETL